MGGLVLYLLGLITLRLTRTSVPATDWKPLVVATTSDFPELDRTPVPRVQTIVSLSPSTLISMFHLPDLFELISSYLPTSQLELLCPDRQSELIRA